MSIFQTGAGYRDPTKAMSIKALQERQKQAAASRAAQMQAASTTPILDPLQGIGQVLGQAMGGIQEAQASNAESAGRQQLAQIMSQIDPSTGPTQQQLAEMQVLDPEFANRQYEAAMKARQDAAAREDEQTFQAGESELTRRQQTTERVAGETYKTGRDEDAQAATAEQNDLSRQADMARQKMQEAAADGRQEDQQLAAQELARLNAQLDEEKAKTAQTIKEGAIGGETAAREKEADRLGLPPGPERDQFLLTGSFPSKGTQITNTIGGGQKLDETLDVEEGKIWTGHQKARNVAAGSQADFQLLDELIKLAPQGPITGNLMSLPVLKDFSSAGAAFNSIVQRVAPTLRVEGSGSTSDIEYAGMLNSLPRLGNYEEANALITGMMKAKAQINMERGDAVNAYRNGEATAIETRKKLAEIDSRSIMTPELDALLQQVGGGASGGAEAGSPDIDQILKDAEALP